MSAGMAHPGRAEAGELLLGPINIVHLDTVGVTNTPCHNHTVHKLNAAGKTKKKRVYVVGQRKEDLHCPIRQIEGYCSCVGGGGEQLRLLSGRRFSTKEENPIW